MNDRKIFVLDTSVLLYDKQSIYSFPGNDVVIPIVVLDELDLIYAGQRIAVEVGDWDHFCLLPG